MKLKLIIASMSVLGFISAPVFAADATDAANAASASTSTTSTDSTATTTTTTSAPAATEAKSKVKHHHHHVKHHHHYVSAEAAPTAEPMYKGMAIPVPQVDVYAMTYDLMGQNAGRGKAMPDWFNRIGVSGGVNLDGHWGSRTQGYMGENYTRVSVNDAHLDFAANVNDWTKAFASLSYSNFSSTNGVYGGTYSNAYTNGLNLEQAYVTLANYDVYPVFFQVGKQYTDYGRYTIHPLYRTMTQVMTESLQTSAKLGFITQMGLHGDIYAFSNPSIQFTNGHANTVYGAALGFDRINEQFGFGVGVGYMSDLTGVNDIQGMIGNTPFGAHNYVHTVGGIAVYGDLNSGPFSVAARYTTAIQSFNPNDLSTQFGIVAGNGAKPWAADITAGYNFMYWNKSQNVYIGYQASNNAVNLALPKNRWLVGYNIDYWRNTNLGIEWDHDNSYSSGNNGNGKNSNAVGVRGAVKFG